MGSKYRPIKNKQSKVRPRKHLLSNKNHRNENKLKNKLNGEYNEKRRSKTAPYFRLRDTEKRLTKSQPDAGTADQNDAVYLGKYSTKSPFPLVLGIYGIPYLINLPGSGRPVHGELYAVSDHGLARIDDLEATAVGHYDRLPVQVVCNGDAAAVEAECYFAGRGFGEGLWIGKGREGLEEYTEREAVGYVRKDHRSKNFPWF